MRLHCCGFFLVLNDTQLGVVCGSAADLVEKIKIKKYGEIGDRFRFVPVAIETSGNAGSITAYFLKEIGGKLAHRRKVVRKAVWLGQRIGIAVVRGNAYSVMSAAALPRYC